MSVNRNTDTSRQFKTVNDLNSTVDIFASDFVTRSLRVCKRQQQRPNIDWGVPHGYNYRVWSQQLCARTNESQLVGATFIQSYLRIDLTLAFASELSNVHISSMTALCFVKPNMTISTQPYTIIVIACVNAALYINPTAQFPSGGAP